MYAATLDDDIVTCLSDVLKRIYQMFLIDIQMEKIDSDLFQTFLCNMIKTDPLQLIVIRLRS